MYGEMAELFKEKAKTQLSSEKAGSEGRFSAYSEAEVQRNWGEPLPEVHPRGCWCPIFQDLVLKLFHFTLCFPLKPCSSLVYSQEKCLCLCLWWLPPPEVSDKNKRWPAGNCGVTQGEREPGYSHCWANGICGLFRILWRGILGKRT